MDTLRARRCRFFLSSSVALIMSISSAEAFDIFGTNNLVSTTPAGQSTDTFATPCKSTARANPLNLRDAIDWALCHHPKTAEAWANVKVAATGIGLAKAAYLPTISTTSQALREHSSTTVSDQPQLDSGYRASVRSNVASLNWVLYDFGGRNAALKNAAELLAASYANQNIVLQEVFLMVAKDFYAAQAASGMLEAAKETESNSEEIFLVAKTRVVNGIAPISEQLQAQTSYAQAVAKRNKAEGDLRIALGTLAADMNLSPAETLEIPVVEENDGIQADSQFNASVKELIESAKRTHPSILAAQAQLNAAIAKEDMTYAQGMPQISLVGRYSNSNQPTNLGVGALSAPSTARDRYIGIQLTIPLFEGFAKSYQLQQARAQSEVQRAILSQAEQKAGLEVWRSYQNLQTYTQNLDTTASLIQISRQSYAAVRGRYRAGVGNIIELLSAQVSLADAKQQRVQALTDWRTARLDLAAKLGRLSMGDI